MVTPEFQLEEAKTCLFEECFEEIESREGKWGYGEEDRWKITGSLNMATKRN